MNQSFKLILNKLHIVAVWMAFNVILPNPSLAECVSFVEGPVLTDIAQCKPVDINSDLALQDEAFSNVKTMPAQIRDKLLQSYRGMLITGKIVQSDAVQTGLGNKGALEGKTVKIFMRSSANQCQALTNARAKAVISEACCDGSSDAPCMLKTSYFFKSVSVVGKAGSSDANAQRKKAEGNPEYRAAVKLFKEKKYKDAAKKFAALEKSKDLDLRGYYLHAMSYHRQEQCEPAIKPLEYIAEQVRTNKVWADDDKVTKPASLLLARCYAKILDTGKAMLILNGYLLSPQKNKQLIESSLKAPEFGAIHTTKEYIQYRRLAEKKLAELNGDDE